MLLGEGRGELGGSEYLKVVHDLVRGRAAGARSRRRARAADAAGRRSPSERLMRSAHDCSDGGLAVTLAECCFDTGGIGAEVSIDGVERRRATRRSTSRRRCSANRRRASSCRWRRSTSTDGAASMRRRRGVPARVIGRDRRQPAARSRSRGAIVIDQWRSTRRSGCGRRRSIAYFAQAGGLNNMFDKFKDECGVFGIFGHPEAANMTYLGLYALQHRGQESAGIAASDGEQVRISRAMGYVADVFDGETLSHAARPAGDRPRPLLDGRREQAARTRSRS